MENSTLDVAVIGGGLAGLTAATLLARGGQRVTLFERASVLGGRARTTVSAEGYHVNLGPHALYRGGAAARVLKGLGVAYRGGSPGAGGYVSFGETLRTLPTGPVSLLTTDVIDLAGKFQFARQMLAMGSLDYAALARTTLRDWLDAEVPNPTARALIEALARTATYSAETARVSAGDALAQLDLAVRGKVLYLDGGWQTLVDGLRAAAERAGVQIAAGATVAAVARDETGVRGVALEDGRVVSARAAVAAVAPAQLLALLGGDDAVVARWSADATPVRAACLDVTLRRLPRPHALLALGADRPLYASVHSTAARLAPAGGAVVQLARYLTDEQPEGNAEELAAMLDALQPGWRDELVSQRFLPSLTVTNALPEARRGGIAARPGPAVAHVPGLYAAGDWVGPHGMLADAALASAEAAARAVLARAAGDAPGRRGGVARPARDGAHAAEARRGAP